MDGESGFEKRVFLCPNFEKFKVLMLGRPNVNFFEHRKNYYFYFNSNESAKTYRNLKNEENHLFWRLIIPNLRKFPSTSLLVGKEDYNYKNGE